MWGGVGERVISGRTQSAVCNLTDIEEPRTNTYPGVDYLSYQRMRRGRAFTDIGAPLPGGDSPSTIVIGGSPRASGFRCARWVPEPVSDG